VPKLKTFIDKLLLKNWKGENVNRKIAVKNKNENKK
jgi:hypothetical protein